jgi:hypothetical protein
MSRAELKLLPPCPHCVRYAEARAKAEKEYQANRPPDSALPIVYSDSALKLMALAKLKPKSR